MGIQRFDAGSGVNPRANGQFVLHCDHEAILEQVGLLWAHKLVERDNEIDHLRAELAAKSKDAERYQWLRQLDNAFDFRKLPRTWSAAHTPEQLDDTIDAAMGEGNGR